MSHRNLAGRWGGPVHLSGHARSLLTGQTARMRLADRRRRATGALAAGLLLLCVATLLAAPSAGAASCGRGGLRCLRVSVPLDRSGVFPGTIGLRVRVAEPSRGPATGTVLALAGGPGQAAAGLLGTIRGGLPGSVLRTRRLVTFDQRGTGDSGRLRCPELSATLDKVAVDPEGQMQRLVAACAQRLGPARAHFATADTVADIEAVRVALGVERLVLYGTSYGTKVALDYAAAYPQHVSRLVLDSVVPPEGGDPFERATLAAIPRVLKALCARGGCPFTRDPSADLAALAQRLARGPQRGYVVNRRGRRQPASIARRELFALLLAGDLNPSQRFVVPAAVRAALTGDPALLLRLASMAKESLDRESGDSETLFLATTCADSRVAWPAGTPVAERGTAVTAALAAIPPEQLAPFGAAGVRELGFADLCRAWPEAPVAQPRLPLPDVPALILSGDADLRTPRSDALSLAARMPSARIVTVPQTGHSVLGSELGDCAGDAMASFLAGREPRACKRPSRIFYQRPAGLPPRSLGSVRPLPGLPPHAGRTAAAVGQTLEWMAQQVVAELLPQLLSGDVTARAMRFGGLRGGSVAFTDRGIVLDRYSVVPGVTISGRVGDGATGEDSAPIVMRIGGRVAAHGWLSLGERWVTGQLGGQPVRVRTAQLEETARSQSAAAAATENEPVRAALPLGIQSLLRRLSR